MTPIGGNFPEVYILGEISAIAPPNAASVRIALFSGGGGGAAFFDDASLTESVAIPEPGSLAALAIGSTVMVFVVVVVANLDFASELSGFRPGRGSGLIARSAAFGLPIFFKPIGAVCTLVSC